MNRPNETPETRKLLSKLDRVKPVGTGWQARCPAHEDHIPSLSIGLGEDGRVLLNCFAGCETETVIMSLGLTWSDLWPDGPNTPPGLARTQRHPSRDLNGELVAYHVRRDYDDGSKQFHYELPDGTTGLGGRPTTQLPLYNGDSVDFSRPTLFIVEGQQACDALKTLGVEVVSTYGANVLPDDDCLRPYLTFPTIMLWPDADTPGHAHMTQIASRLTALGHQDVRILTWPQAHAKDDAADFVEASGNREQLAHLENGASLWSPPSDTDESAYASDAFLVNGLRLGYENVNLRDGTRATVVVKNGLVDPIAVERGDLDDGRFRERIASSIGLDPVEILRFRQHLRQQAMHPTAGADLPIGEDWRQRSIEKAERRHDQYLETGIRDLDRRIGGFTDEQLIVISGQTGGGKTAFMVNILRHNATQRGLRCGFISLEMSGVEIFDRLVTLEAGWSVNVSNMSEGKRPDICDAIDTARSAVSELPITLVGHVPATLPAVLGYARRLSDERNIDLLFVDQIHTIKAIDREHRTQLVGQIANELKQLARDLGIPVITAAQMNRDIKYRNHKLPMLDDLRDSAEIGHQADLVLFIHHRCLYDNSAPPDAAQIIVAKNRDGASGFSVDIRWTPHLMKIRAM